MANFIIGILEQNKDRVQELKEVVFHRDSFFNSRWAHDNLGIIVAICSVILVVGLAILAVVCLPVAIVMITINAFYNLFKKILGSTYFYKRFIRKALNEYEDSLNDKNTYFLCDKGRGGNWQCVVLDPNMEDFMEKFFKSLNTTYDTYETVTNKLICRRHRRRSIGDIYLICKNYYPDTNLDEVLKCLIRLVKTDTLAVSKCSDIKKYVFVKKDDYTGNYFSKDLEFIRGVNLEQLIAYYERNGGLS